MIAKIKRVGSYDGYSNLTINKTYVILAWFLQQSGMTFTTGGGGGALALIVDDTGALQVTTNVLDHTTGNYNWDFVSATYEDCTTATA